MIDSRISLVVFGVFFTVMISFTSTALNVDGISCSDPSELITQPDANETTVSEVTSNVQGLVNVFFGCSSSNPVVNGFFLALQAGIIIIILFILKDVIPLT